VPALDRKHDQVGDQVASRYAIEFPSADEAAQRAEHLGIEDGGTWKTASVLDNKSAAGLPGSVNAVTATEASRT
jgi:hypothetical protein